jgi:plastocyanin
MRGGLALTGAAALAAALGAAGCSAKNDNPDLVAGKKLFVQKCGSCHVLQRAGTKGVTGPDLDEAFQQARAEDFGEDAIQGVVYRQILHPARGGFGGDTGAMPSGLVKGEDAHDVAAYVAQSAAKKGKDSGLLAAIGQVKTSTKAAVAKNGTLTIPADPNGNLAFVYAKAEAPAGKVTFVMPNKSGVPHNIAVKGKGQGKIVTSGESTFTADFTAGTYTYICEVQGHEQAGMKGTLTVK